MRTLWYEYRVFWQGEKEMSVSWSSLALPIVAGIRVIQNVCLPGPWSVSGV